MGTSTREPYSTSSTTLGISTVMKHNYVILPHKYILGVDKKPLPLNCLANNQMMLWVCEYEKRT